MSDLDDLQSLLTRWGVHFDDHHVEFDPPTDGTREVVVERSGGRDLKRDGYGGFYTRFVFDTAGNFVRMGAWE